MRFGLDVAQQRTPWDELVRRVQLAEALGFDGVWGFDHLQPMYGEGPGETFEGMTTLAALAGVTSRIRLGLLVTGVTYRHPSVLAAQAVTVDHASHGRLDLSLGAAWYDKEHHELGIPFPPLPERYALLEDALEIATRLFTGEVVSYDGHVVSLRDARLRPVPVQQPRPPIWIGGSGPRRTLPLVSRYAVNTTSAGLFGLPNNTSYATAKGAVVGLTRSLATAGAADGIKVNCVAPGAMTRLAGRASDAAGPETSPDLVAPMVALLAHEDCPVSGEIYAAGFGRFARIFIAMTPGHVHTGSVPTIEDVAANWAAVNDETGYGIPADLPDWSATFTAHLRPDTA